MSADRDCSIRETDGPSPSGPIDSRLLLLSFSVLFGLVAAVLSGYFYGLNNHAEHLPLIFRVMDPGYLTNDFFVNAASEFGPRYYYTHMLAFVAGYVPLHAAMAVIWLSTFVAVSLITAFAGKDVTGSFVGGMIAVVLVTFSKPFYLGIGATPYDPYLLPRFLALPFGLFAIWKGIRGQPICAATAAIPSILVHPSIGLQTACLAMAAATANRLQRWLIRRNLSACQLRRLAVGILLVGLTSLLWIVPMVLTGASFSSRTEDLITINAYFRLPHHLVPSTWQMKDWILATGFAVVVAMGLIEMFRMEKTPGSTKREHSGVGFAITSTFAVILIALLGGYIFIEIIPSRLAVAAHFFKLVLVVAWLGWIVIAGLIGKLLIARAWHWAALFAISAVSVPTLLVYKGITFVGSRMDGGSTMKSTVFFAGVGLLVFSTMALTQAWIGQPTIRDLFLIALGMPAILLVSISSRLAPAAISILVGGLVAVSASFILDRYEVFPKNIPGVSSYIARHQPIFTLDDALDRGKADDHALTIAARDTTDPDAVFLIPWDWHQWRVLANRAAVVDRKSFPFQERAMEEWYERYLAIYGPGAGYPYDVTESELLELQRRYGFHYAVVPIGANMSFPVTATSERWKLVQVAETVP